MDKTIRAFYGPIKDQYLLKILNSGIKQSKNVIKFILFNIILQIVESNEKALVEQKKSEEIKISNIEKEIDFKFSKPKEIKYERKFPDNKGVFYYPLTKNFISIEEEKKFNHYYGEENVDRVSKIDKLNRKDPYLQDDIITNLIFLFLICSKSHESELLKSIKQIFQIKNFTRNDIKKRIKILYDRYHGCADIGKSEFWYMSCKMHEMKNILTLFQNNKQIYCNIDNIYDCSLHSNNDPNFDNPSCYNEIKYLKSYKKLLEYSIDYLYGMNSNENINHNNENNMIIESSNINENENNNDESNLISINRSDDKKNKEIGNNFIINNNINNDNINNNDLISNASSKIQSINNSKENEEINNEIILQNKDGSNKVINLNRKKEEEENPNNINKNNSNTLKNIIIDLVLDFNQTLKNIKCHNSIVSQIKQIKFMEKEEKKPCSELCYKNLLSCEENLYNLYIPLKDKQFPIIYESLIIKFIQMLKFDPCRISKLIQTFIKEDNLDNNSNFELNCSDIYIHLLSQKFIPKNIIKKELFDLNIKERDLGKKNRASITQIQSKKIEENNLKKQSITYVPCVHFGNEICDERCPCSKRGYCEIYCKCNQILCKFAYHGCHCSKGDCTTNHCPCYINGRECNPQRCKNCNILYNNDRCKNMQLQLDFESKLIVGISDIAGWGLFANEDIKKDNLIGEYKGELINDDIVNKRDRFKEYERSTYMFKLDDEYTVDSRRMGNMLRYANHSKNRSNSFTKIVFSSGHRKIGLFAKKNIKKGEEILFDYDGQGILGKQFPWINNEKKLSNPHNGINEKLVSNINYGNKSNSNIININEKDKIFVNDIFDTNIINKKRNIVKNNIRKKFHSKRGIKKKRVGRYISTLINDSSKKEKTIIEINEKEFNKKLIVLKDDNMKDINIEDKAIKNNILKDNVSDFNNKINNNLINFKEESNIKFPIENNSEKKIIIKNTKNLFKTEEDEIKNIRNNYEKNKENNIFDLMYQIRENLSKGEKNNKFLNKKREEPKFENKFTTNKFGCNLNMNNNNSTNNMINNENSDNSIIYNIMQKNKNLQSVLFKEVRKYIEEKDDIQNEKEMKINIEINKEENEIKLRKPVFAGEMRDNNKLLINDFLNRPKICYNFIKCEYLNNPLIKPIKLENSHNIIINNNFNLSSKFQGISSPNFNFINNGDSINNISNHLKSPNNNINNININNKINNINNNINNIINCNGVNNNNDSQIKNKIINNIYNLGTIRLLLNFENPIVNDFSFYSPINSEKLKNIKNLEIKQLDLRNYSLDIDFEKDICGYLNKNLSNKGPRIYKDYLDCFENMSYYSFISEINSELFIISKGPFYSQIESKYNFNNGKNKKLLFIIKNR